MTAEPVERPLNAKAPAKEEASEDDRMVTLEALIAEQRQQLADMQAVMLGQGARERLLGPISAAEVVNDEGTPLAPDRAADEVHAEHGGYFRREDAFRTWRVLSRNPNYSGETEGFGFSNGQAVVAALAGPSSEARINTRVMRLNNLRNYPVYWRERDERTRRVVTRKAEGYILLTQDQYDREFADRDEDGTSALPLDF